MSDRKKDDRKRPRARSDAEQNEAPPPKMPGTEQPDQSSSDAPPRSADIHQYDYDSDSPVIVYENLVPVEPVYGPPTLMDSIREKIRQRGRTRRYSDQSTPPSDVDQSEQPKTSDNTARVATDSLSTADEREHSVDVFGSPSYDAPSQRATSSDAPSHRESHGRSSPQRGAPQSEQPQASNNASDTIRVVDVSDVSDEAESSKSLVMCMDEYEEEQGRVPAASVAPSGVAASEPMDLSVDVFGSPDEPSDRATFGDTTSRGESGPETEERTANLSEDVFARSSSDETIPPQEGNSQPAERRSIDEVVENSAEPDANTAGSSGSSIDSVLNRAFIESQSSDNNGGTSSNSRDSNDAHSRQGVSSPRRKVFTKKQPRKYH